MSAEIVQMKARGFICVNAHPAGCARNIERQIAAVRQAIPAPLSGIRSALVIGASTGYGLASRIVAAWGFGARTLGVFFERPPAPGRTATAGYYNTAALHAAAGRDGLAALSLNGDAFSDAIRQQALECIARDLGPLDLVIYSLASPKRTDPRTGVTHNSVLKPVGRSFSSRTIDLDRARLTDVTLDPATPEEVAATVAVMGGDDWRLWIEALRQANLLAPGVRTLAYSYIGPELTWPIYKDGTIGQAKNDLFRAARELDAQLQSSLGGHAWVSVNKAIVTQASSAIPVVPLYLSLLLRVLREKGQDEDAIGQIIRLAQDHLAAAPRFDPEGRIRLDDRELQPAVQAEIARLWPQVTTENLRAITAFNDFERGFRNLFGFEVEGVDYAAPVELESSFAAG